MQMDYILGILDIDQYEWVDNELANRGKIQELFFLSIFTVLGYLSKSDGKVTKEEELYARSFMSGLELTEEHNKIAFHLYTEGTKYGSQIIEKLINSFKNEAKTENDLILLFLEILINIIYSDKKLHVKERQRLRSISSLLGISEFDFNSLEKQVKAQQGFKTKQEDSSNLPSNASFHDACDFLGVPHDSNMKAIKSAYRKLVSKYHPDKLIAKGLPEEMIKIATEKSASIHVAYDHIIKILNKNT